MSTSFEIIPFEDFGGSGPLLHFAHANGFPPRAYTPFLETLIPHYHVVAVHNRPLWPGATATPDTPLGWDWLTDDLLAWIDSQGISRIIGVGHSMGGTATLFAAIRRPDLFHAIILIDPTLLSARLAFLFGIFQRLRLVQHHPLVRSTLRRRRVFPSQEAMYARYRNKAIYRRIDERGLRLLVSSQTRPCADGQVELKYSPAWEAHIYATTPHNLWSRVKPLQCPVYVIAGGDSFVFGPASIRQLRRRLPQATLQTVAGAGHLVPLERPVEVGRLARTFLETLE